MFVGGDLPSSLFPAPFASLSSLVVNGFSRKIIPNFSENFRKIWQYKFSETAFLAETAGNGVWDLVGDANSDPMVYKSSKSAFWRREIQFSVKIRKFGTISCESPLISQMLIGTFKLLIGLKLQRQTSTISQHLLAN